MTGGDISYLVSSQAGHNRQLVLYTPGSSNAAMWSSKKAMELADRVSSSRRAGKTCEDYMPISMKQLALVKASGGVLTTSRSIASAAAARK